MGSYHCHRILPCRKSKISTRYDDTSKIPPILDPFFRAVADAIQSTSELRVERKGLLEKIDLGDVAAENEIRALKNYFVKTPQFQQTIQGHTQVVVGRKGSGKTAIFYGVREELRRQRAALILDLKPDGHQLIKLRDALIKTSPKVSKTTP